MHRLALPAGSIGSPGAVEFVQPFFGSGYSVEFDGATWQQQDSPTPNMDQIQPWKLIFTPESAAEFEAMLPEKDRWT